MIKLQRSLDHRWIIDKNVSSKDLISQFADVLKDQASGIDYQSLLTKLTSYQGRPSNAVAGLANSSIPAGHSITFGVRILQLCYYMFGYTYYPDPNTKQKIFMPSPATVNILSSVDDQEKAKNMLVNFYGLQYPHPFNRTPDCFHLYAGRLIVQLLLEPRLNRRLYIDEFIWFLPFIEKVTPNIYKELVDSIIEYRALTYEDKLKLFKSIPHYEEVFSNVTHEINYYLLRILDGFGVIDLVGDPNHNGGKLLKFKHGDGDGITIRKSAHAPKVETYRNDAYISRAKYSGYAQLSENMIDAASKLADKFPVFDVPSKESDQDIPTRNVWLVNLYEYNQLSYLNCINTELNNSAIITSTVQNMIHASKYGSRDGKEFENALKPFMYLFRETLDVNIISGAGNTDLLCAMEDNKSSRYKVNVEAKTRKKALEMVPTARIMNHIRKHGAEFCLIVAPRFASGVNGDMQGYDIVAVRSEVLGAYCYKECQYSGDGHADFTTLRELARNNRGTDITQVVYDLTMRRYGIAAV